MRLRSAELIILQKLHIAHQSTEQWLGEIWHDKKIPLCMGLPDHYLCWTGNNERADMGNITNPSRTSPLFIYRTQSWWSLSLHMLLWTLMIMSTFSLISKITNKQSANYKVNPIFCSAASTTDDGFGTSYQWSDVIFTKTNDTSEYIVAGKI